MLAIILGKLNEKEFAGYTFQCKQGRNGVSPWVKNEATNQSPHVGAAAAADLPDGGGNGKGSSLIDQCISCFDVLLFAHHISVASLT